jgi:hypothetical protein
MEKSKHKAKPKEFGSAGFLRRYSLAIAVVVFYATLWCLRGFAHRYDEYFVGRVIYPVLVYSSPILFITHFCAPPVILIMVVRLLTIKWRQGFASLKMPRLFIMAHLSLIVLSFGMGLAMLSYVLNRDSHIPIAGAQFNNKNYQLVMTVDETEYFETPALRHTVLLYECDSLSIQCDLYNHSLLRVGDAVALKITDDRAIIKTNYEEITLEKMKHV